MNTLRRRFYYRCFPARHRCRRRFDLRRTAGNLIRRSVILLLIFSCIFGLYAAARRVSTVGRQAAAAALNRQLTDEINAAMLQLMQDKAAEIRALTQLQKDSSGALQSMQTDYALANRIKAELLLKIGEKLNGIDTVDTAIPIGLLLSDTLYTGAGFHIPIRVFAANAIDVSFRDEFTDAGINQTRYALLADITVTARVGGAFGSEEVKVSTQIPMTETILLGKVPDHYIPIAKQ